MPYLNEAEIIGKAKTGDPEAFRALVMSYQRFVYSIAFRFTGNASDAEDLMQEAFIRVWKNLDKYDPTYKMKTWVGKIVSNLGLDYLKSARKKNESKLRTMNESLSVTDHTNPQKQMEAEELHAVVLKLADGLTPKQKAVFILRDLEMMEVAEVCDILKMTAEHVKSNLYHARVNMKSGLTKHYNTLKNEMQGM